MAEEAKKTSIIDKIKSFFRGVKAEYSKIVFPSEETIRKQTIAVIVVSVALGLLIFVIDLVIKYLLNLVL